MSDVRKIYVPEKFRHKWLCIWEDEKGRPIINEDREYLCVETPAPFDKAVEERMRKAVASYGIYDGGPRWMPGRKITNMEWDDQMERLLDGKIPDEQQAANLWKYGESEEGPTRG